MAWATSTTYAGGIVTRHRNLDRQSRRGELTLSGPLTYTTTNNANADLRGGVTRITAGTLALTGTAAIPGGITDPMLGNLYTSVDVRTGATLNVAGTSSTYSTAALQQIVGPGTITGNFNHDEGRIRPG